MSMNMDGIDIDAYGAAGNGVTDDTNAFKRAIADAIAQRKPLYLGAKNYKVTDTILNAKSVNNITIIGKGMDISRITFATTTADKPLIKMELCYYPLLKGFTILGSGKRGVGIMLGRYDPAASGNARWNAVAYGQFDNLKTAGLKTGIHHDAGWINNFFNCNVRDSETGFKLHGNAINVYSLTSEANDIGMDILRGDQNSTINLYGGTIEVNNRIGLKVRYAHDLNLFGTYFEDNPEGHIVAGTDSGDAIETINIVGGSLHFPDPVIFDRVDSLNVSGLAEVKTPAPFTVTSNVKQVSLPAFQHNFDTTDSSAIEAIQIEGRNRQSSVPWFTNDLSSVSFASSSSAATVDTLGDIAIGPIGTTSTLSGDTANYLTGNRSVRCKLTAGKTYAGMTLTIKAAHLQSNALSAKLPVLLGQTLDSFRVQVQIRYNVQDGSLKSIDTFDYVPAFDGDYGVNNLIGRWMSFIVPINIAKAQSQSGFKNLYDIKVNLYGTNNTAAKGDEWFCLDSIDLYPAKYITDPYGDDRTTMFSPLEISPTTVNVQTIVLGGKKTTYASSIPNTGTYSQGDYVQNTLPAILGAKGSRYVVKGWIRLTNGSSHTLNVDWAEDRSPTGT